MTRALYRDTNCSRPDLKLNFVHIYGYTTDLDNELYYKINDFYLP